MRQSVRRIATTRVLTTSQQQPLTRRFLSSHIVNRSPSENTQSPIRFNYDKECEEGVNAQINYELHASYVYMSLASYFDQATVSLPGTSAYFQRQATDEREHALAFMHYQNDRGGDVQFSDIQKPPPVHHLQLSSVDGFTRALELERQIYNRLLELYKIAEGKQDFHLTGFLQDFINEQQGSMKDIVNMITKAKQMGSHHFDQMLLQSKTGSSNKE
jgi:ferritin heavy chain